MRGEYGGGGGDEWRDIVTYMISITREYKCGPQKEFAHCLIYSHS